MADMTLARGTEVFFPSAPVELRSGALCHVCFTHFPFQHLFGIEKVLGENFKLEFGNFKFIDWGR